MPDTRFSILKALAILLVVLSHAGISGWLSRVVYSFHVPVFFLCAGYFFHTKYLADERTYVVHRVRGIYFPFLRWSILFLLLHNLFFSLGILSETYGNAAGGVTHPYTWHQAMQHLWSIVFNMSGYDPFLGGAFWFFRAYLLASFGFLLLFKLLRFTRRFDNNIQAGWGIFGVAMGLITWKITEGLTLTGVAQGGYRELMGIGLMALGFLMRQYEVLTRLNWKVAAGALALLLLSASFFPTSMAWNPDFATFISLPLPAVTGFLVLFYIAQWLNGKEGWVKRGLSYIGTHTLYIFAFHLLAFKVVSALKVAWYDLPWEAVGGHPVVNQPANNVLWVLFYLLVGVSLPLLGQRVYAYVAARVTLTQQEVVDYLVIGFKVLGKFCFLLCLILIRLLKRTYQSVVRGMKEIIAASNPKDE